MDQCTYVIDQSEIASGATQMKVRPLIKIFSWTVTRFMNALKWLAHSIWFIAFMLTFTLFVASHTVASVAILTSAAFSAVAGVTTIVSEHSSRSSKQSATLAKLDGELELERDISSRLASSTNEGRAASNQLVALRQELVLEKSISNQLAVDLGDESALAKSLSLQLSAEKRQVSSLSGLLSQERVRTEGLDRQVAQLRESQTIVFRGRRTPVKTVVAETISVANTRIAKTAATNLSSIPAESIPFYGIAFVVAATAFEIDMACRTMDDFHELQLALDPNFNAHIETAEVCGLPIPSREEVWAKIQNSPSAAWNGSATAFADVSEKIRTLEAPNFEQVSQGIIRFFDHWYD